MKLNIFPAMDTLHSTHLSNDSFDSEPTGAVGNGASISRAGICRTPGIARLPNRLTLGHGMRPGSTSLPTRTQDQEARGRCVRAADLGLRRRLPERTYSDRGSICG